ncbi:MAG: ABC transporter ATP-binding protein [Solirubrobacterales bacterium]
MNAKTKRRVAGAEGSQAPAVLSLTGVVRRYGEVEALRGVSLDVEAGELLSIVGPSGSGKSTLLQIMGTLDRPTEGTVVIDGYDASAADEDELAALRARRIGFIFQRFFLLDAASALENVCDGLLYNGTPVDERRERSADALRRVGLGHRVMTQPSKLSGGERQRVAIARALVSEPAIILADEPTGNLDTRTSDEIIDLLGELNEQGSTIVVVTHDLEVAEDMPRRVAVRDGLIERDERS